MARRGRQRRARGIEDFAEDLGRLLGTAQAKAQGWIGQRQMIAKQLQQIRDTASGLLTELAGAARGGRGGGRTSIAAGLGEITRVKRKLSAKARKAISDAQKRRWAAARAEKAAKGPARK